MLDEKKVKSLLLSVAQKDAAAFDALYQLVSPLLLGVVLRIVMRREMAEDILHDVFVKVWNNARAFDPVASNPVGWLVTIARNRAFDVLGSADVSRVELSDGDYQGESTLDGLWGPAQDEQSPAERLEAERSNQVLRTCIEELGAAEKQTLVLAYYHGMSHADLAAHMQKPLGTVKTWVRRGMASLKQCLETCMANGK